MDRLASQHIYGLVAGLILLMALQVNAAPESSHYAAKPPLLSNTSAPLVMLAMSVDHELFKKAYSDYTDLDADGELDTSYEDGFDYLGYFDSSWCYQFTSNRFQPIAMATGENRHFCTTSTAPWSGNFLNWASMSRMDILRKVLFGGKRSTDTTTLTVLERAYLPRDVHAFGKVYDSSRSGVSTLNYTPYNESSVSLCNVAEYENGTPTLRVARGSWPRWSSTAAMQCQWGRTDSPPYSNYLTSHNVYVEACVDGKDAATSSRCKTYPNGNSKPVGLLQQYGESGAIWFGLLTGSYDKNISGGVLRKNIGKLAGNENSNLDEVNLNTGQFKSIQGIIHNINQFRIARYSYSQNIYTDCNTYGISVSSFKLSRGTSSTRRCTNWGNPLSEIYLETLRYFAGQRLPTSSFDTSQDARFVPGITRASWSNPMNHENACANCSIILLSTGLNSFDADQLSSSLDLPGLNGTASVNDATDAVGEMEFDGAFAGNYLVGGTGGTRHCRSKYLSGLSQAIGICPEVPQLEGGYHLAGLAWYANTSDLRPSLAGKQSVRTYAIELAESIPNFTLDVDGKAFNFQPVCQASSNFGNGPSNFSGGGSDCTLIDVVVDSLVKDSEGNVVQGRLTFVWEDSYWGNDYDFDAASEIQFCVGSHCNGLSSGPLNGTNLTDDQVRMFVQVKGIYAGLNMRFSYTVTGANSVDDGLQTNSFVYKSLNNQYYDGDSSTRVFSVSADAASTLPKPMFLAAKYGGFIDLDGDKTPGHDGNGDGLPDTDNNREWDTRNNLTGARGSDGVPDNYFFSRNPTLLASQLGQVLEDISSRVSSATNAALFANSSTGTGAIYQALFQPNLEVNGKSITWGGILHSLFIDNKGHIREDGNRNARLDDYSEDKIIELYFDPNSSQTMVQRYSTTNSGVTREVDGSLQSLSSLKTIWDARDQLSQLSNVTDQRNYHLPASGGRHMFTWLDANNNSQVDDGEQRPFVPSSFTGNAGFLGVSSSEVTPLVNYIRGQESDNTRSRTIDYDGDGLDEVWRLGDIVHSTPRVVAAPDSRYDAWFKDSSYKAFRNHYLNRRHVLYVGANDGLIHAFNSGFWDESEFSYVLTAENNEVSHPLGSEIWSYAPMNLLPHLRWLPEEDYPHVYYMDSEPLVFDANIFEEDADHPGGWGTVLVVGMRFGGGNIEITVDDENRTMRSAWVVLDVTNPEQPPELLAEITHPDMGFTTARPALIKRRVAGVDASGEADWRQPVQNDWYLVMGSGPSGSTQAELRSALDHGTADQNLHLFIYDLSNKSFVSGFDPLLTSSPASYAGDIITEDWNRDFQDDVVYFGTVETGGSQLDGKLMRLKLSTDIENSTLNVLLDAGQPITAQPLTVTDSDSYWVYSGTGRLQTYNDNRDASANYFYGLREPLNDSKDLTYGSVSQSNLVNVGNVAVFGNGDVLLKSNLSYDPFIIDSQTVESFDDLKNEVAARGGWKLPLSVDGVSPSGRSVNRVTRQFTQILFTEYQPSDNSCSIDGISSLFAVHYQTGTASPSAVLGYVPIESLELERSLKSIGLGIGYASSPVVHRGEAGKLSAITQGAGGSISSTGLDYRFSSEGRQSWWQIFKLPWVE
ncbi:pilus assembly protein [Endozoicomonas ascidiicola]|uniref:pilus assembly protein n=1 Tax=Endozoicomonas ascidiicola TaxID=1698521 RepID=UPI00082E641C|nr:PilC/PilY family type IV pilus protein [Endozoicomonas ascidiicola]